MRLCKQVHGRDASRSTEHMLCFSDHVKVCISNHPEHQLGHDLAIAQRCRPALERVDDPLDAAVHSLKSKGTDYLSQGWAAWT